MTDKKILKRHVESVRFDALGTDLQGVLIRKAAHG